jgi:hypothetical protein
VTTRTKVQIDGDSTKAKAAVNGLSDRIRAMARTSLQAAGSTARMTAAVLGAESVVAGLRLAMNQVRTGITDYLATNAEAEERVGALGDRFGALRARIGEYILGGENAAVITGTLTGALDLMTGGADNAARGQHAVRTAIAAVVDAMGIALRVVSALRLAWGGLQVAIAVAGRTFEAIQNVSLALGISLLDYVVRPIALVVDGLRLVAVGAARLGEVVGGPVERATAGLADGMTGLTDSIRDTRQQLHDLRASSLRGAASAFDGLGTQIDGIVEATGDAVLGLDNMAGGMARLADETRSGASALRSTRREIEQTAAAAVAAQRSLANQATGGASSAIATAMEQARAALAAKETALSEQASNESERKAARMIAAEESITAAREAALLRASEQEERLAALAQKRAEVMQSTGATIGESLAIAVGQQQRASQQIIAVISRELTARIIAATAAAGIFAATPGGQFFAAALGAAVTSAGAALAQLGGGGNKGRKSRSAGTSIGSVNVNVYNQGGSGGLDPRVIRSAVEEGIRRGTIQLRPA